MLKADAILNLIYNNINGNVQAEVFTDAVYNQEQFPYVEIMELITVEIGGKKCKIDEVTINIKIYDDGLNKKKVSTTTELIRNIIKTLSGYDFRLNSSSDIQIDPSQPIQRILEYTVI